MSFEVLAGQLQECRAGGRAPRAVLSWSEVKLLFCKLKKIPFTAFELEISTQRQMWKIEQITKGHWKCGQLSVSLAMNAHRMWWTVITARSAIRTSVPDCAGLVVVQRWDFYANVLAVCAPTKPLSGGSVVK